MINKRILSTLLALAILLSCVGWTPVQAQGTAPIDAETPADQTSISTLPIEEEEDELPEREPIARLYGEEGDDLNKIVYLNNDGTRTMHLYDYPVKYRDASGEIHDISLEIADGTTELDRFQSAANSIMTAFPSKASDGISLSGEGVSIKLIPNIPEEDANTIHMTGNAKRIDSKTISYDYDAKTTIEYSLTYTGFKEDIVVSEYTGQTEYEFLLQTNGLALTQIDGSFYLTDESGKIKAAIGDVIVFTADEKNNTTGMMEAETLKENHSYLLTIVLDAQYLADPNTAYPIRIDPTIDINYDANGSGAIEDVTIYSNVTPDGASTSLFIGLRETRGISRILMRFPNLDLSSLTGATVVSAEVTLRDLICEGTYLPVYCYPFTGANWTESTASWSMTQDWGPELDNEVISYHNGVNLNPKHRYSFNITAAVQGWINGTYSKAKGLIFKTSNEVETATTYEQRQFASYNRTNYRPTFTMSYVLPGSITAATNAVNEGGTLQLTAHMNGTVTWTSSDTTRATISSNGLVTAKKAGQVTITATCADYAPAIFTVYVTKPDGVYYIRRGSLYLSVEDAGITNGTSITQEALSSDSVEALSQTWRIHYLGNGYYSVRPMHKLNMGLDVTNGVVDIWGIGTTDTLSIPEYGCWKIVYNTTGYVFINNYDSQGEIDSAMRPNGGSSTAGAYIYNDTYNTTSSTFRWTLTPTAVNTDAIIYSNGVADDHASRVVEQGMTCSLAQMNIEAAFVCAHKITQTVSVWRSSNEAVATVDPYTGAVTAKDCGRTAITATYTLDGTIYLASFMVVVPAFPLSGYELDYEPEIWNEAYVGNELYVKDYTNCYAYILNNQFDPSGTDFGCNSVYDPISEQQKQQPGDFYNAHRGNGEFVSFNCYDEETIIDAVKKDFEAYNAIFGTSYIFEEMVDPHAPCPAGSYRVALVLYRGTDYHWYRQDSDGYWSHKQGLSDVTRLDAAGELIIDIENSDLGLYDELIGFFVVTPWNNLFEPSATASVGTTYTCYQTSNSATADTIAMHSTLAQLKIGMTMNEAIEIIGFIGKSIGNSTIIHEYCVDQGGTASIVYCLDASGVYRISEIIWGIL